MPALRRHEPLHLGLKRHRIGRTVVPMGMPLPVAPPARGGDVDRRIGPSVLLRHKMFSGALKVGHQRLGNSEC